MEEKSKMFVTRISKLTKEDKVEEFFPNEKLFSTLEEKAQKAAILDKLQENIYFLQEKSQTKKDFFEINPNLQEFFKEAIKRKDFDDIHKVIESYKNFLVKNRIGKHNRNFSVYYEKNGESVQDNIDFLKKMSALWEYKDFKIVEQQRKPYLLEFFLIPEEWDDRIEMDGYDFSYENEDYNYLLAYEYYHCFFQDIAKFFDKYLLDRDNLPVKTEEKIWYLKVEINEINKKIQEKNYIYENILNQMEED